MVMNREPSLTFADKDIVLVSTAIAEGNDPLKIDRIVRSVFEIPGITLIEVDPNKRIDRTNVLFGGRKEVVKAAAETLIYCAFDTLDLTQKPVDFPWLSVLDNISFLPLQVSELPETTQLASQFAQKISEKYSLPIYLYGNCAKIPERQSITHFRDLNLEKLKKVISSEEWKPDFGPRHLKRDRGALIVGSRLYHLTVAIYFDTEDVELIEELSQIYKHLPTSMETPEVSGNPVRRIDRLREVTNLLQNMVVIIDDNPEEKWVRMLCNIPDYTKTPLHKIYEIFEDEAARLGIETIGMSILSYVPAEALFTSAKYFRKKIPPKHSNEAALPLLQLVIKKLKLNAMEPFSPRRKILDLYFMNEP
ncbi:MAG: hypothetical protein D6748_15420 [Calditrichaeota bacterium]|nr:MAG: hypothetical protein D6748_15420 [Calditrichota bacterium]